jgi:hemoglobin-like flavoprotein
MDTFYSRFFTKSAAIPPLFAGTDFVRQKRMLRESLLLMLTMNLDVPEAREEIIELGQRHGPRGLNIDPELYPLWLEALCETIACHDPEFSPQLEQEWRKAMQPGIDLILEAYREEGSTHESSQG